MSHDVQTEVLLPRDAGSDDAAAGFDPVLLAVISKRLDSIVREMTNTLLRTGRSALLNTARDFSCSIVTAGNELLACAEGLPIHVIGSQYLTEAMQRFHPVIREGDAFLHNDPYNGNTHHADHTLLAPVFFEGRHVLTAIAKAHQADCGNGQPTTYASYARDVYDEGALSFPCVKVQEDYTDNDDVIRMCRNRIRVPDQWYGDYLATLGAARTGERRLTALIERYGLETIEAFTQAWFDYSERRMIKALRRLPKGSMTGTGHHDPVQGKPEGIPLRVTATVDPDAAIAEIDFRDNIDCVPNGFNQSRATATSAAVAGFLNQLPDDVPPNDGSLRRIRVHLRENCVAGIPRHPASCSVATTNVADRLISITQAAFAELGEGFGLAEGGVGMGPGMGVISGADPRQDGAPYINQLFLSSIGGPGTPRQDGWLTFGVPVDGGLMYRDSVEVIEQKYPILIDEVRVLEDSEGAGRFRGAPGSRTVYRATDAPVTVAYMVDGCVHPPAGVRGGQAAAPHDLEVVQADGSTVAADKVGQVTLAPGDRIVETGGGGGGYGPARERDPERVRRDVEAGMVTRRRAEEVYGVVLTPGDHGTWVVDAGQTRQRRTGADHD
jgi:N-methylhydantoinase B